MDFLKTQLERLQAQFALLTASQKMLSVSLVAIMVMTLAWWSRYAGTAEMQPLLEQDASYLAASAKIANFDFKVSQLVVLINYI